MNKKNICLEFILIYPKYSYKRVRRTKFLVAQGTLSTDGAINNVISTSHILQSIAYCISLTDTIGLLVKHADSKIAISDIRLPLCCQNV